MTTTKEQRKALKELQLINRSRYHRACPICKVRPGEWCIGIMPPLIHQERIATHNQLK